MDNLYTVTGATGKVGRRIVERLVDQGKRVRAVGRSAERLATLVERGAEAFVGDLQDLDTLERAYEGSKAVFAMIPPSDAQQDFKKHQFQVGANHVEALRRTRVPFVVALSSVGAHLKQGAGIVQALHDFETGLAGLGDANVLVLRPGYFYENLLMQTSMLEALGAFASPLAPDLALPMVASQDVADRTVERFERLLFRGFRVEYVLGERDLSYREVSRIFGQAIGRGDLGYLQVPRDQARLGMLQTGMSENVADLILDMSEAINEGRTLGSIRRTDQNTTPTTIEEFAKVFARVYRRAA